MKQLLVLLLLSGCSLLAKPLTEEYKAIDTVWDGTYVLFRGSSTIDASDPYKGTLSIRMVSNFISVRSDAGKLLLRAAKVVEETSDLLKIWAYVEDFAMEPSTEGRSLEKSSSRGSTISLEDVYGQYVPDLSKVRLQEYIPLIFDRRTKNVFKVSAGFDKTVSDLNTAFPKAAPEIKQTILGVEFWMPKPPTMLAVDEIYTTFYYYTTTSCGDSQGGKVDEMQDVLDDLYESLAPSIDSDSLSQILPLSKDLYDIYFYCDPDPTKTKTLMDFDANDPYKFIREGLEAIKISNNIISIQNSSNAGVYQVARVKEIVDNTIYPSFMIGPRNKVFLRELPQVGVDAQGFPVAREYTPDDFITGNPNDAPLIPCYLDLEYVHRDPVSGMTINPIAEIFFDKNFTVDPKLFDKYPMSNIKIEPKWIGGSSLISGSIYNTGTIASLYAHTSRPNTTVLEGYVPNVKSEQFFNNTQAVFSLNSRKYFKLKNYYTEVPSEFIGWYVGAITTSGMGITHTEKVYFDGKMFNYGDWYNYVHSSYLKPNQGSIYLYTDLGCYVLSKNAAGVISMSSSGMPTWSDLVKDPFARRRINGVVHHVYNAYGDGTKVTNASIFKHIGYLPSATNSISSTNYSYSYPSYGTISYAPFRHPNYTIDKSFVQYDAVNNSWTLLNTEERATIDTAYLPTVLAGM